MDIQIYDSAWNYVANIENPISFIWKRCYYEAGSFELQVKASERHKEILQQGYYVRLCKYDDMMCVIEKVEGETDDDGINNIIVSGRDMVKVLSQRCLDGGTTYNGFDKETLINDVMQSWFDRCLLNPPEKSRKIYEMGFNKNTALDNLKITCSGGWANLMEAVQEILKEYEIGIRCIPNWHNSSDKRFTLELYKGKNTSVVFSDYTQTLGKASYYKDLSSYSNVAYVAGEAISQSDTEAEGKRRSAVVGEANGINRYELYVDARDLQRNEKKSLSAYTEQLKKRGREKLTENGVIMELDAENIGNRYRYRRDYDVGDKVSTVTCFGIGGINRITAVQETWDKDGYSIVPTFSEFAIIVLGGNEVSITPTVLYEGTLSKGNTATVTNISAYSILLFYLSGKSTPIQVMRSNTDSTLRGDAVYMPESGNMYQLAVNCDIATGDTIKNINSGQIKIGSDGDVSKVEKVAISKIVGLI